MGIYRAQVCWSLDDGDFRQGAYSRRHVWGFDGGLEVAASASPAIVPLPLSAEEAVDPEEALVAALASCHMLFFLDFASRSGIDVVSYIDAAEGHMKQAKLLKL